MDSGVYRYRFASHVALEEVEASLVLAFLGAESLHGSAQVQLDAAHYLDAAMRTLIVDGATAVGLTINRLLVGYLRRELAATDFQVERVSEREAAAQKVA